MSIKEIYNNDIINTSSIIKDQLLTLIKIIKDSSSFDKPELYIDINIQVFSLKKIEDKKRGKIFFSLTLNDDLFKYGGFILMENELSNKLQSGNIIKLKKISSKRVRTGLYIMIKEFSIINNQSNALPKVKMIKEVNECFFDEDGNNVEEIKKKIKENNKKIQGKRTGNCNLNFDKVIQILNEISINNKNENYIKKNNINNNEINKKYIYTSLKELTTFSRNFIIFVRIIKKSEIKIFETRNTNNANILTGQGKLFYFIVLDKEGNEMQCTCFNKTVDKFYDQIEEDKLYEIKGGYVKINDKKYTRIKSDYKIVLDENSTITQRNEDNSIIKRNYLNIVSISDLQNLKIYTIVDICAVVLDFTEVVEKNTRNGLQPLKKIILGDASKYKVELSLWRMHSQADIKKGDILLINNVKVGEYKGRNLSTFEETTIKINPIFKNKNKKNDSDNQCESCVNKLKEFIEQNKDNIFTNDEFFSDFEKLYSHKLQKYQEINEISPNSIFIKELLENFNEIYEPKNLTKITATVTQIIHNAKNFYIGCNDKNCKKKLIYDFLTKDYSCPGCGRRSKRISYYYTLSLRVKDASCEYWIDIFGRTAEYIMLCTAEQYKDFLQKRNYEKLNEISNRIEFKIFNFWVRPRLQVYNTISKKKLYTYKISPVNEKEEAHKLMSYLEKELNIVKNK